MSVRKWTFILAIFVAWPAGVALAQSHDQEGPVPVQRVPVENSAPKPKDNRKAPPRSDQISPDESSSKQTEIDVAPPKGDEKHPGATDEELGEFHPYDPHKAAKCIEVGDYYLKQGNYPRRHQPLSRRRWSGSRVMPKPPTSSASCRRRRATSTTRWRTTRPISRSCPMALSPPRRNRVLTA